MLECAGTLWRTKPCWTIIANLGRTQVRAATRTVASAGDVVQTGSMTICIGPIADATGIAGQGIDTGNDRRGDACAAKDEPAMFIKGVVDRNSCAGISIGSHSIQRSMLT